MRERFLILKIDPLNNSCIHNTGGEVKRSIKNYTNLVENELSSLNVPLKPLNSSLKVKFNEVKMRESYISRGTCKLVTQVIVSASREFFEDAGYIKGRNPPKIIEEFFEDSYNFILKYLGDNGDKNILAAYIHYDETTPHLQVYLIPVCEYSIHEKRVKDENGSLVRDDGREVYERDENGNLILEYKKLEYKTISYSNLIRVIGNGSRLEGFRYLALKQEEEVGVKYGLVRGEMCLDKKSLEPIQIRYRDILEKLEESKRVLDELKIKNKKLKEENEKLEELNAKIKEEYESVKSGVEILKKVMERDKGKVVK